MVPNKVSVVVAVSRKDIKELLDSLARQDFPYGSWEVILVTHLKDSPIELGENMRRIDVDSTNPSMKRNRGINKAEGELIAFIDDNAIAPADWLKKAWDLLKDNPGYIGAGGPNLMPPGADRAESITDAVLNTPFIGSGHSSYSSKKVLRRAKIGDIHLVNMFVWKKYLDELGGFNENIGYGCEDSELIFYAENKFGKIFLYNSDLWVYHHRRKFGLKYLKQRLQLRFNNGRMILAYPSMYLSNLLFLAALLGLPAGIVLLLLYPPGFLAVFGVYFVLVAILNILLYPRFFPVLSGCYVLHHLAYVVGIWKGFISGLVNLSSTMKIRRL